MSEINETIIQKQEKSALPGKDLDRIVLAKMDRSGLLDSDSGSLQAWVGSNVWNPVINTLVIDTHNAATSSINDISKGLGGKELLNDWQRKDIPEAKPLTGSWLAQNVSGGLAMIVPYGLAAIASKGGLNKIASNFISEGAAKEILTSRATATIIGASIYDAAKKPLGHETRFGNALGSAVGFSVFESGNALLKAQKGLSLIVGRAAVGSIGATSQLSTAHFISTGEMASSDKLWNAALTGAVMNNALPAFQDKLSSVLLKPSSPEKAISTGDLVAPRSKEFSRERLTPELTSNSVSDALGGLKAPEAASLGAKQWKSLLQNAGEQGFDPRMVPARELPELLKTLSKAPETPARNSIVDGITIESLYAENSTLIQSASKDLITTALKNPDLVSKSTLRSWLDAIPEGDGSKLGANRQAVIDALKPAELAKIVFGESAAAENLAKSHPDLVRRLVREQQSTSSSDAAVANEILKTWNKTGTLKGLPDSANGLHIHYDKVAFKLIEELSQIMPKSDRRNLLQSQLSDFQSAGLNGRLEIAARIASGEPLLVKDLSQKLSTKVSDSSLPYQQRIEIASELARLSREEKLPGEAIEIPDARMKAKELPTELSSTLRESVESVLSSGKFENSSAFAELSKLMPEIFGKDGKAATELTAAMRKHPEFAKLSPYDQVNVLWAGLLSKTGEGSARLASGHEMVSANIAEGVLKTLKYPPERIQRINNLISRQADLTLGELPNLQNPQHAMEVAVALRHPAALKQVQIFNEAKTMLETGQSTLDAAQIAEFKRMSMLVTREAGKLPPTVPILTSSIAPGFRVGSLPQDFVVMSHSSPYLTSTLRQLALIESPNTVLSATLNTPKNLATYNSPFVLLLAAAPEQIGAATRAELVTGHRKSWNDHVALTSRPNGPTRDFLTELNDRVYKATEPRAPETPTSLRDLGVKLAQFDSLADLDKLPKSDPRVAAQRSIVDSITRESDNSPLFGNNEVTVQNPRVQGLGIVRNGQTVSFENVGATQLGKMFPDNKPSWLRPFESNAQSGLLIPESVWRDLQRLKLPIQSMD